MGEITRIGMDTSKGVFHVHGIDGSGQVVLRRMLRRHQVVKFFAKLAPPVVALEACGGSHHWGRVLEELGHEARLLPTQLVKPYVRRNKNDAADAEAICEAMGRPRIKPVPVKTVEQQAELMVLKVRDGLVRRRTQLGNQIRGHAIEFGLVGPRGTDKIGPLLERIAADPEVPEVARGLFAMLGEQYTALHAEIVRLERKLRAWHRGNPCARRLTAIEGLGPIGAAKAVMKAPDPHAFACGRSYAAWLGLTVRDLSSGGKTRHGGITRAGDEDLRSTLILGATSVIKQVKRGKGPDWPWLRALVRRKPPKVAAVALANKMARMIWKLMVSGETYDRAKAHRTIHKAA